MEPRESSRCCQCPCPSSEMCRETQCYTMNCQHLPLPRLYEHFTTCRREPTGDNELFMLTSQVFRGIIMHDNIRFAMDLAAIPEEVTPTLLYLFWSKLLLVTKRNVVENCHTQAERLNRLWRYYRNCSRGAILDFPNGIPDDQIAKA